MPENETLLHDPRSASRWSPISARMDSGRSPTDLFPAIEHNFYASLQKAWKQWRKRGIDPGRLFNAAVNDPKTLQSLIKQSSHDRNAQLLRDVAAELREPDMKGLIRGFLNAAWEEVESRLQINRRDNARPLEFISEVHRMLKHITRSLLKDQSRFPKRPPGNEPPPDLDTQLGESLL